jgi:flagellar biosynthesis/type III secretory pathway M-ring protein FliF/YscJ
MAIPTPTPVNLFPEWWSWFETFMWVILLFIGLIIVYYIIRELRLARETPRLAEIELEKEKLKLMKMEYAQRGQPFFKVSPEKMEEIRNLDEENVQLETDIYAKHNTVEKRIQRLENMVKSTKLDHLIEKIKDEERKVR